MIDVVPVVSPRRTVAHHCSGLGSEGGLRGLGVHLDGGRAGGTSQRREGKGILELEVVVSD